MSGKRIIVERVWNKSPERKQRGPPPEAEIQEWRLAPDMIVTAEES